jgi:hypothetical protein
MTEVDGFFKGEGKGEFGNLQRIGVEQNVS